MNRTTGREQRYEDVSPISDKSRGDMSLVSYQESKEIEKLDPNFDAIIMAAIRKADTFNTERLKAAFPEIYEDLFKRYNAPGGRLNDEEWKQMPLGTFKGEPQQGA